MGITTAIKDKTQRFSNGWDDISHLAYRCQRHKKDAIRESIHHFCRRSQRQPRLANPTGTDQIQQPAAWFIQQQPLDLGHFLGAQQRSWFG
ncbi:MAG: hypothetical protein R2932_01445 [Caldilineaceae bacterium]